jgi:hypothetical protein
MTDQNIYRWKPMSGKKYEALQANPAKKGSLQGCVQDMEVFGR